MKSKTGSMMSFRDIAKSPLASPPPLASPAHKKHKRGKLRHVRIEKMKNGFTVHAEHEMPQGPYDPAAAPQPHVFTKHADMMAHVHNLTASDNDGDEA